MPTMKEMEAVLFSAWDSVSSRMDAVGLEALTSAERAFAAVWTLEAEVNNGGFDQYMFNSAGDEAETAREALRAMGAHATLAVFEDFLALVPNGSLAPDRGIRQRQLAAWTQKLGEEELENTLSALERRFHETEDDLRERLFEFAPVQNLVRGAER